MSRPPECDPVIELRALGVRLRVDLTGATAEQLERFRQVWHRCLVAGEAQAGPPDAQAGPPDAGAALDARAARNPGAVDSGTVDAGTLEVGDRFGDLAPGGSHTEARRLMQLTQEITRELIAAQAGRVLMLHAGALAHPVTGASIVYVAPGGTGKTTVSRTFGTRLAYLTDETVAITATDAILPYPKPLSIRREPHDGVKDETAPGELGLLTPTAPPWVAGLVVLRRDPDVRGLQVEDVDLLDALPLLAPETSSLARLPRPLHRLADLLESTGGLRLLRYDEATALRPVVDEVTGRTR